MRYEKILDPEMTVAAAERFLALLTAIDPDVRVISSLTDVYVYLKKYRDTLDWTAVDASMNALGMSEFEAHRHPIREAEAIRIFEAIAAEEFGNGAPVRDMPSMSKLYYRLRVTAYRRKVTLWRRTWLYLFKRES
jgi:hypothetical protein